MLDSAGPASQSRAVSSTAALRHRSFRLLLAARTVSVLGTGLAPVALAFAVLELPGAGASTLGLVLAAHELPMAVFVLVGGVIADRLPRHRVMAAADLLAFASQGLLAALFVLGAPALWQVMLLSAISGTGIAVFMPASTGLVPATVPPDFLQSANAVLRLSTNGARILGAAVAGVLVATLGTGPALAVDAATFLISGLLIARIRLPHAARERSAGVLSDLRHGWREFTSRQWVWAVVAAFALINMAFAGGFLVLGPLIARDELGGPTAWATVLAAESAGMVLGVLVAMRVRVRRPILVCMLTTLGLVPPLVLLAAGAPVLVLAAVAFASGVLLDVFMVLWDTTLQQHVPEEVLSRVSAYDWFGSLVFTPLGFTLVGPVAAGVGVDATLYGAAGLISLAVLLSLLSPEVRRLESRTPAAAQV